MNTKIKNAEFEKTDVQTMAVEPAPDHHAAIVDAIGSDEHAGQGGVFVFDPSTGKRRKVEN